MQKILLVGGEGYIGSRLRMYLNKDEFSVESVDLKWYADMLPDNKLIDINTVPKDYLLSFDTVIFLSAHASVKMGSTDGLSSFNNNLVNFVKILDHLNNSKVKLIYASSSSVYGKSGTKERTEDDSDEIVAANFYDLTKKEMDLYSKLYNVESYGLRFGTVNGWSPHLRVDIMLNAMNEAVKHGQPIRAYNLPVNRPILSIDDLCKAVLAIVNSKEDKRGIYNLASLNNNVGEIARIAGEILNARVEYNPGLDESVYDFSISSEKFKKAFNFEFSGTIESILKSLEKEPLVKTNRNTPIEYRI
jgi:nucleoside-diphosphate-sugar epimerase